MSKSGPEGLGRQVRRHHPQDSSDEDSSFPATYSRVSHLGRQPEPSSSSSSSSSTTTTTTALTTILGRQTEEPYLSRILLDACLRVYNENHPIGKFVLELSDALDQASCEIARGHAIYYDQVEFKWWEPEPGGKFVAWAVARPRHLIAKYRLLKCEFDAILVDCEIEANGGNGGAGLAGLAAAPPFTTRRPGYHHHHHHHHHYHHDDGEPSASKFFQMLSSEPTRDFLIELKAWTADMRAFIVDESSKVEKRSADLSRLRQVRPGR